MHVIGILSLWSYLSQDQSIEAFPVYFWSRIWVADRKSLFKILLHQRAIVFDNCFQSIFLIIWSYLNWLIKDLLLNLMCLVLGVFWDYFVETEFICFLWFHLQMLSVYSLCWCFSWLVVELAHFIRMKTHQVQDQKGRRPTEKKVLPNVFQWKGEIFPLIVLYLVNDGRIDSFYTLVLSMPLFFFCAIFYVWCVFICIIWCIVMYALTNICTSRSGRISGLSMRHWDFSFNIYFDVFIPLLYIYFLVIVTCWVFSCYVIALSFLLGYSTHAFVLSCWVLATDLVVSSFLKTPRGLP